MDTERLSGHPGLQKGHESFWSEAESETGIQDLWLTEEDCFKLDLKERGTETGRDSRQMFSDMGYWIKHRMSR